MTSMQWDEFYEERVEGNIQPSYSAAYALLLSWADDDLGVVKEIDEMAQTFDSAYGFQVERYLIPSKDPDDAFEDVLKTFVRSYQNPRTLLIVYYGGHGMLNPSRLGIWAANKRPNSPQLKWYSHQRHLENSNADVLLLLDCCQPLGGGGSVRSATGKQVLAACGFGCDAPGVGPHSFSRALIEELWKSALKPFSTAELHHRVLNSLRSMVPDYDGEQRKTPVLCILGEGGIPSPAIRLVSYRAHPINLIALMGGTGSGKSSLINRVCRADSAPIGDGQESLTKEVSEYITVVNGETVTLIDTPGFDDTYLSDRQVLERISAHLFQHYKLGRKLNGLLFLRDINLTKMTGSAMKNLDMFTRLCGEESPKNVMLLTTKWDESPKAGVRHESELIDRFWAVMIKLGSSRPKRLGRTMNNSAGIVDPITDVIAPILKFQPTFLQIQRELGEGNCLIDTAAGRYVDQNLSNFIKKSKEEQSSLLIEAEKAQGSALKSALKDDVNSRKHEIDKAKSDRTSLRDAWANVLKIEVDRRSELFGYNQLGHVQINVSKPGIMREIIAFGAVMPQIYVTMMFSLIWLTQAKGLRKDRAS